MLLLLITYTAAVTSRVNLHGTIPSADCLRNTALHGLRTADAFPVVASLPPENSYFSEGEKLSDDRKCVCCSQAKHCNVETMLQPVKPCRNNVAALQYWAKNRRCFLSLVTSPLACMLGFPNSDHVIYSPGILPFVFFTRTCAWDGI